DICGTASVHRSSIVFTPITFPLGLARIGRLRSCCLRWPVLRAQLSPERSFPFMDAMLESAADPQNDRRCSRINEPRARLRSAFAGCNLERLVTLSSCGGFVPRRSGTMCTLSFFPEKDGYLVGMNRDEQVARSASLPPERFP